MVFLNLKDKVLFNKIGRRISITYMEKTLMPQEYGMELTSHKGFKISYGKQCFLFCFKFICFL